jgi:Flagellar protein FliT
VSPYDALVDLAERELEFVNAGDTERLPEIARRRAALLASLPPVPPADAKPLLERMLELQDSVTDALRERRDEIAVELRRLSKGRTAMRGYAPTIQPRKLVDRAG